MSRSRSRSRFEQSTRVSSVNSNRRLRSLYDNDRFSLTSFEDRRLFNPEGFYAPARSFSRPRSRIVVLARPRTQVFNPSVSLQRVRAPVPTRLSFALPQRVLICVRRKVREQVLHALKKTGRGGQRKPRYNYFSSVKC